MKNFYLKLLEASAIGTSATLGTEAHEINLQGIIFNVDTIQHYLAEPATHKGTTTSIPATILDEAGVEKNIATGNNSTVEYYDINDAKVEDPQKENIYIIRRGNTIVKAIY